MKFYWEKQNGGHDFWLKFSEGGGGILEETMCIQREICIYSVYKSKRLTHYITPSIVIIIKF